MTSVNIEPKAEEAIKLAESKKADADTAKNEPEADTSEETKVASKIQKPPTLAELVKDSQERTRRLMEKNGRGIEIKRQHQINLNKGAK